MPMSPGPTRPETRELADAPAPTPEARLFALSLDLLGLAGFDGYLKLVNPAWESVLGWTEDEIYAQPVPRDRPSRRPGAHRRRGARAGERPHRDARLRDPRPAQGRRAPLDRLQRALHRRGAALRRRPRRHRPPGARGRRDTCSRTSPSEATEAETVEDALQISLRLVCRLTGWSFGKTWRLNEDGTPPGAGRLLRADAARAARVRRRLRRVLASRRARACPAACGRAARRPGSPTSATTRT